MSYNNIYEVAKVMQNKNLIKEDLNEVTDVITNMFKDKYLNKVQKDIEVQKLQYKDNPTKEVNFLKALKPFMKEEQHNSLEKAIDTFVMLQTFQNVQKYGYIKATDYKNKDTSIHSDGVYEIDKECMLGKNKNNNFLNMLFLMALSNE